jgi:hypothetical protein
LRQAEPYKRFFKDVDRFVEVRREPNWIDDRLRIVSSDRAIIDQDTR